MEDTCYLTLRMRYDTKTICTNCPALSVRMLVVATSIMMIKRFIIVIIIFIIIIIISDYDMPSL